MPTQTATRLQGQTAQNRERHQASRWSYRSTEAALPLLLPRARADPRACSEPDPERGDVREVNGGSG